MIDAVVEESSIVRDEDETPLSVQVVADDGPSLGVEMVRRLVDEQKAVLLQEKGGQQGLGPFPAGEGGKRAVERVFDQIEERELSQDLPLLTLRRDGLDDSQRLLRAVGDVVGKVIEGDACRDGAAVLEAAEKEIQKGCLPSPVSSGEAELPVRVDLKADVLEDRLQSALVGEGQVGDVDQRHEAVLL